jgi:hypothetical protein
MPAVANAPTTRDDYLAMVAGAIVDASKRLPRPRRATGARDSSPSLTSPAPSVEPRSWRVYAVSDLHADMPANMRWLEALPSFPPRSALIVAGDVATAIAVTRQALLLLKARFEEVIWCPGNHELWLPAAPNDATLRGYPDDSLGKLMSLIDLCVECGVRVGPTTLPGTPGTAQEKKTPTSSSRPSSAGTTTRSADVRGLDTHTRTSKKISTPGVSGPRAWEPPGFLATRTRKASRDSSGT